MTRLKATAGNTHLGGEDFVNRMVDYMIEKFREKSKLHLRAGSKDQGTERAIQRLRTACEEAKRTLSTSTIAIIEVDSLYEGVDFQTEITRDRFEVINMDLFNRCIGLVDQVLENAKVDKSKIHDIVLVGGSTRIPKVQELLSNHFNGKTLCESINPDGAVAWGAAAQAAILTDSGNGISPAAEGISKVNGIFDVDAHGIPKVTAVDEATQKANQIRIVDNRISLSKAEIERMVNEAEIYKAQDKKMKRQFEAKDEFETYCYSMRNTFQEETSKLNSAIEQINSTISWLEYHPYEAAELYEGTQKQLEAACSSLYMKFYPALEKSTYTSFREPIV